MEKLFINSQIEVWYIAFLTIFYKPIPHLGNQAKFVSFSSLPPTKKVIEPQMFHDFLVRTYHCSLYFERLVVPIPCSKVALPGVFFPTNTPRAI